MVSIKEENVSNFDPKNWNFLQKQKWYFNSLFKVQKYYA